tara:strand:+ start:2621 stop:2800 length:180 start_codon:yes stop_codon:yes gene_type:complete
MKEENRDKKVHLNLKITNQLFMIIDGIRTDYLLENKSLPSRSMIVRMLLEEAIQNRENS